MAARNRTPPLQLTERDHELLHSLYKYRYASVTQLQRLHFPSTQTTARRLRALEAAELVATFTAVGVDERLVALTDAGAGVVAEDLLIPLSELPWTGMKKRPKDYLFMKHHLAVSDFRIALTAACTGRDDVELLGFIPEHYAERKPDQGVQKYVRDFVADIAPPHRKIVHTPDAVFALGRAARAALFFLEVDRGTETLSDPARGFAKTIRFYLNYLVADGYQRYVQDFELARPFRAFRVLVLTTTKRRATNMRTLGGNLAFDPPHAKRFVWVQSSDQLDPGSILGPCWRSLDPTDDRLYAIAPSPAGSPVAGSVSS